MRAGPHVMLVRDARTGTHSLVRPIGSEDLGALVGAAEPGPVNALMAAKTPSQLIEAVEPLGPFWRDPEDMGERLMDAANVRRLVADGTLGAPNPVRLIEECALDPFWRLGDGGTFEREGRNPVSDARQAAERRGPCSMEDPLGREGPGGGRLFALEPLQDWVVMRNLISVAMRLWGVTRIARDKGTGDVLSRARFRDAERTAVGAWLPEGGRGVMVLPVAHTSLLAGGATFRVDLACPFLGSVTEGAGEHAGIGAWPELGPGRGVADVRVLTAPVAGAVGLAIGREVGAEGRLAYLTLCGAGQRELANDYVSRLDALLGTRRVRLDGYASSHVPLGYPTAAGSVWATIIYHPGRYLMTCKQCGRTVLSTTQGAGREFCGDTCRAAFNKARRREASGRGR